MPQLENNTSLLASLNMRQKDSKFQSVRICFRRDIYEEEIIALNDELEHLRHMGGRIIAERTEYLKHENQMLKELLREKGVELPEPSQ